MSSVSARPHKIPESVLVVIHTPALEVLLIERADKPGYWQSVTGSKDSVDEPLAQTCEREVAEETGIVIGSDAVPRTALRDWALRNVYEIYPVWRHRYAPGGWPCAGRRADRLRPGSCSGHRRKCPEPGR